MFIGLSLLLGLILALLPFLLGPITLPIVFFLLLVLPWMIQDAFRIFIWLIVTWPLLYIFVRISLPAGIPDVTYERVLVPLLVCVFILEVIILKRRRIKLTTLDILALVYAVAQLSSRLFVIWFGWTGDLDLNGLLDGILIPLVLYWVVKSLLISRGHLKWLLRAFVIACLLISLTGLFEQAMGVKVFDYGTGSEADWGQRATGAMRNPAVFGAVLGMGILAGFSLLSHTKRKLPQAALKATIWILLYGVFASYTRSAWISVFFVLFAAQFFVNNMWKRTLPIFILGLLLLAFIWPRLPSSSSIVQRTLTENTITNRLDLMDLGWKLFLERPFLGWGSNALNTISRGQGLVASHNIYLTFLVDGGVVLFLSFFVFFGYLLAEAIRIYGMFEKGSLERNALVAMVGSILIFLLSGLSVELRYFGFINALVWICAGVIDFLRARSVMRKSFT